MPTDQTADESRGNDVLRLKQYLSHPGLLFAATLLVSGCYKLTRLSSRELWLDETYSAYVSSTPFGTLLRNTMGDLHPPLYHMLLWGWVRIVGHAPAQLRAFSVLLSLLATAAMFALGRRVVGTRLGAYAAALFAFAPMLFVYSLEVRSYMLFLLLLACLVYAHWRAVVDRSSSMSAIVLYATTAAALFYVHYLAAFVLIGFVVHALVTTARDRRSVTRLAIAAALTVCLMSPGIYLLVAQRVNYAHTLRTAQIANADPQSLTHVHRPAELAAKDAEKSLWTKGMAAALGVYPAKSAALVGASALPLVLLLGASVFLAFVRRDTICLLFVIEGVLLCAGVFVLHLHATRYLLPIVPFFALAAVRVFQVGLTHARIRPLVFVAVPAVLLIYLLGFVRQANKVHGHPWQNVVQVLQQNYRPGDPVVFSADYAQVPFDYYARLADFAPASNGFPVSIHRYWDSQPFEKGWGGPVILQSDLDRYVAELWQGGRSTVWVVLFDTQYYDPDGRLIAKLRESADVVEESLPPDPDAAASPEGEGIHLYRARRSTHD